MARNRMIKPDFWTSETIVELSMEARLFFIGLWNFCDDSGVHPFKCKKMKMQIFPCDNIDPEPLVNELLKQNLIVEYKSEGLRYIRVRNWSEHQTIRHPVYKYPLESGIIPEQTRRHIKKENTLCGTSTVQHEVEQGGVPNKYGTSTVLVPPKEKEKEKEDVEREKEKEENTLMSLENPNDEVDAKALCAEPGKPKKQPNPNAMTKELFIDYWNQMAQGDNLPKIRKLNNARLKKLKDAIKDIPAKKDWELIIFQIPVDQFRRGHNDRRWKANVDWLFRNNNYMKLLEEAENDDQNHY